MFNNTNLVDKYHSESGEFLCINGIAQTFKPAISNIVKGNIIKTEGLYNVIVKTLIVPSGVKGFASNFCRGLIVQDIFTLSDTVESIGDDAGNSCVFANTSLPEVVIPETVEMIGDFAFGNSNIKELVINAKTSSPYLRQFKGSTIGKVYLPYEHIAQMKNDWIQDKYGFYRNFYMHCRCNIVEY
jgi:hypothetical protein